MKTSSQENLAAGQRYLSFNLKDERYAVPLLSVREVIAMPEITPVPQTPAHFLGIMNLRGQVISIVDLRSKFGIKPAKPFTEETAVIICDIGQSSLGIVVCSIQSVLSINPEKIQNKPDIAGGHSTDYITGVAEQEERLVLLLDIAKALSLSEVAFAKNATNAKAA